MSKLKGVMYIVGGVLLFVLGAIASGVVLLGRTKGRTGQYLRGIRDGAESADTQAGNASDAVRSGRDINNDLTEGSQRYKRLIQKGKDILASGTYRADN